MKTSMQEFFTVLKEFNKDLYNTMHNEGILQTALEKEKGQIERAYKDCHDYLHVYGLDTEKYFNDTFETSNL